MGGFGVKKTFPPTNQNVCLTHTHTIMRRVAFERVRARTRTKPQDGGGPHTIQRNKHFCLQQCNTLGLV